MDYHDHRTVLLHRLLHLDCEQNATAFLETAVAYLELEQASIQNRILRAMCIKVLELEERLAD